MPGRADAAGAGHEHPPVAPPAAAFHAPAHGAQPVPDPAPPAPTPSPPAHGPAGVTPDEAVRRLAEGNERFVAHAPRRPNQDQARLCDTFANGQHPFAAVLTCADSRVPPELVLDAGIGDLFVVRVAGNVADTDEVGTIEYGVEHLGITTVLVLGHAKCGAVSAVVDGAKVTPNIEKLVDNIVPAAEQARRAFPQLSGPRLVDKAVRQNVRQSMADLTGKSDLLRARAAAGALRIVGGVYDLHSGEVDWLEPATATAGVAEAGGASHGKAAPANTAGRRGELLHDADRKPAPTAPRGKPAAGASPANHGDGPAGHGEKPDEHGNAGGKGDKPGGEAPDKPARKENYLAFAAVASAGAAVSYGILHFARRR